MLLVATLSVERDKLDAFRAYEHKAAAIMRTHGGAIEKAYLLDDGDDIIREIHIVRFSDRESLDRYRADPALSALSAERKSCIVGTEMVQASDGPAY